MIKKASIVSDMQQIDRLVARLSPSDKIYLFRKLGKETAPRRMRAMFKEIDERRKQFSVSDKEIQEEMETVKRTLYGPRRR